ncbi:MAG: hypothetical protein A3J93_00815 [Candidatus Magasanikbacteria bacterium RIFOXYC2_FULL_42_28]|uniref:Uncharacterized protein n=1 Tax=Candidatus Magasanikbacteria bacterium RIFOXYC2_FULL_42_28 TaxID=1798704 RepID=A0A1F6NY27_9BACT|nr:MAG: hypothetical protein A3J93_00815 [Candidatus Magasanikbacteria bacterium RIFOXYC2_FULL_42_28]
MPRVKLYEHSAKTIISKALPLPYRGIRIDENTDLKKLVASLPKNKTYVVKVDQGVKKRMKNGLVVLNISPAEIPAALKKLKLKKFDNFLVEEFLPHKPNEEKYFSLERQRDGIVASVSDKGGIDIEDNPDSIKTFILEPKNYSALEKLTGLSPDMLQKIRQTFDELCFSFLEINPLVVKNETPYFLDLAATVDSAGEFFVSGTWGEKDIVAMALKTTEEKTVKILKDNSPAALSLAVINPNGSIFLLLSGGGASLVVADEVANLGAANELANYGEYSGNPSEEETYLYTLEIISLLKKSRAKRKILIIGGGVANFTDVRATFRGIIRALEKNKITLQKMSTKIFVRRGGPGQTEGLASMQKFLNDNNFDGGVYGPELPLQKIVELALC